MRGGDPREDDQRRECRRSGQRERSGAHAPGRPGAAEPRREHLGDGPGRADERERPEHGDLGGELGRLRRDQEHGDQRDPDGVEPPAEPPGRDRLRVGDHEEEKDEDLGREDEHAPELPAGHGPQVPARGHRVPARREHGDPGGKRDPEEDGELEQPQAREDGEAADEDDDERERHPRRHRPPPECERVRALGAEEQEAEDEPEVRGVEDVAAAEVDQVLREQRHGRSPGEDPPAVQAPPVAVLRARDAQDECDAVPGEERARGPHEHVLAPQRDPHFEHCAGQQRDEDLGDRELEPERRLAEHLERDDHRRQVEPRVPRSRQQHRVFRAANPYGRPAGEGRGRAHPAMLLRAQREPQPLCESHCDRLHRSAKERADPLQPEDR